MTQLPKRLQGGLLPSPGYLLKWLYQRKNEAPSSPSFRDLVLTALALFGGVTRALPRYSTGLVMQYRGGSEGVGFQVAARIAAADRPHAFIDFASVDSSGREKSQEAGFLRLTARIPVAMTKMTATPTAP